MIVLHTLYSQYYIVWSLVDYFDNHIIIQLNDH